MLPLYSRLMRSHAHGCVWSQAPVRKTARCGAGSFVCQQYASSHGANPDSTPVVDENRQSRHSHPMYFCDKLCAGFTRADHGLFSTRQLFLPDGHTFITTRRKIGGEPATRFVVWLEGISCRDFRSRRFFGNPQSVGQCLVVLAG